MSSQTFKVVEHIIPCQHIREYPNATRDRRPHPLQLAIKQYVPLQKAEPNETPITIIAAGANGIPKVSVTELYEYSHKADICCPGVL